MAISHSAVLGDNEKYNPKAYVLGADATAALNPQVQEKTLKITSVLRAMSWRSSAESIVPIPLSARSSI